MRFDLNKYETVESRLARFYADHPEGRVMTDLEHFHAVEGRPTQYIVKATLWACEVDDDDASLMNTVVVATGYAEETVGSSPVNKTSALENCETSAIGRALANYNYAPQGARPSREEMAKVVRAETPPDPEDDIAELILSATTTDELTALVERIRETSNPSAYRPMFERQMRKVSR